MYVLRFLHKTHRKSPPDSLMFCQVVTRYIRPRNFFVKRTRFGGTYIKIGTIQRRLAWPLRKDDTQNREAFHIFFLDSEFSIILIVVNKFKKHLFFPTLLK